MIYESKSEARIYVASSFSGDRGAVGATREGCEVISKVRQEEGGKPLPVFNAPRQRKPGRRVCRGESHCGAVAGQGGANSWKGIDVWGGICWGKGQGKKAERLKSKLKAKDS